MQFIESIPYHTLPLHSKLVKDYVHADAYLKPLYHHPPSLDGVLETAKERKFSQEKRQTLVQSLRSQYSGLTSGAMVRNNIEKLGLENSFTVTTGHQLCAYTGAAYFIYKIASTINLARQLSEEDPKRNFIPVFWMASEDHDFEEISEVNFYGKQWKWEKEDTHYGKSPVGLLNPSTIALWANEMRQYFRDEAKATSLLQIFEDAYKNNSTLANATRQIVHELFKEFGLVIIDGNDIELKKLFIPVLLEEIKTEASSRAVNKATDFLKQGGYSGQITPREVNLFYFDGNHARLRVEKKGNDFLAIGSELRWSEAEIINEINEHPEKFSPNVVLRPVYQEMILPNLAYIGGPAEVAYWLQLKGVFDHFNVSYPVVLVRSSVVTIQNSILEKIQKYDFSSTEYFTLTIEELTNRFLKVNDAHLIDFDAERKLIDDMMLILNEKAKQIDQQLVTQLSIENKNLHESISKIAAKFTKSLKQKADQDLKNLQRMKNTLFPNQILQERIISCMDCFRFDESAIREIIRVTNPLGSSLQMFKV